MDNYASSSSSGFPGCLDQQSHFLQELATSRLLFDSTSQMLLWDIGNAGITIFVLKMRNSGLKPQDQAHCHLILADLHCLPFSISRSKTLSPTTGFLLPVPHICIDSSTWGLSTKPHTVRPWLVPVSLKFPLIKPWILLLANLEPRGKLTHTINSRLILVLLLRAHFEIDI